MSGCRTQDAGWCDKMDYEEAKEQICGDCDYEFHKDRAVEFERQRDYWKKKDQENGIELDKIERKNTALRSEVDTWRRLAKARYKKMVDARLEAKALEERIDIIRNDRDEKIRELEKNREFLIVELFRKDQMLERLK